MHRGTSGGVAACTACLEAEQQRKSRREERKAEEERAARTGPKPPVETDGPDAEEPPLPEPRGTDARWWGLAAGVVVGIYLTFLFAWLVARNDFPEWARFAGPAGGALVTYMGVWAIVKSR